MTRATNEERQKHEVYRELEELASEMNYYVDAVVVEGPHDKKTLKLLGYKKHILTCSKRSHNDLADLVSEKNSNVVVLTDFDEQGTLLNRRLSKLFEKRGVKVDRFYRRSFQRLFKKLRIATIEGIYSIIREHLIHRIDYK